MSKALGKVALIAGAVALAATGVGALASAGVVAAGVGATAATVGSYASAVAIAASFGAQLTAKKPAARGSSTVTTIGPDQATCCIIGRSYSAGARVHDVAYGPTTKDVPNPHRSLVDVYSIGPVEGLVQSFADFEPIGFAGGAATGWFAGYLHQDVQLGATPEPAALTGPFGAIPRWGADHRMSGKAAVLWSAKFDRDGKRFASGLPQFGAVWDGVRCYDPRRDDSYPGGAGPHRIDDPATWEWTRCPGLHGLKYALGIRHNGKRVFGVGLAPGSLIVSDFVELANVCDANGWRIDGNIYEPGNRWANLKDILAAGGAEPCHKNARIGVRINAPRVALDTITIDDLAGELSVPGMQPWSQRFNARIPKFRSPDHKWEYVPGDRVSIGTFLEDDGEEKVEERQLNLVTDKDQAAQLVALELLNGRERGPIAGTFKPRLRRFVAGDKLIVDIPDAGLNAQPVVLMQRSVDPGPMTVDLTMIGESDAKYALVAAVTGTAPPPIFITSPQELDEQSGATSAPVATELDVTTGAAAGEATLLWRNPVRSGWAYLRVLTGASDDLNEAAIVADNITGALGGYMEMDVAGVPAGSLFLWVQAFGEGDVLLSTAGPEIGAVT